MSFFSKILGGPDKAERVDYYEEGVALAGEGKFDDALTSFRLALKESPGDPIVLQQIAIAYTRTGREQEAVKTYRHVLARNPKSPGAHYGLAFLLLRGGQQAEAVEHLEAFLEESPKDPDARDHVEHARATLRDIQGGQEREDAGRAKEATPRRP